MKLNRVTRIDSIPAGSTYFNEQGFLHDTPIVTSTGIFEYALPEGRVRRELRLPEHVFDAESLASYEGKPVIITHDAGSIDKNNVMKEIVGTILGKGFQDHDNVRCKVVIHDIDKVKRTPYRELSLGYSLDLIEEPGEWNGEPYDAIQTNIRINHLAIVESARAGEQAHLNLDGKKVELDDKENSEGGKEEMKINDVHGDSLDMTPEELLEAIKQYKASKEAEGAAPVAEQPAGPDGATADAVAEEGNPNPENNPESVAEENAPVAEAQPEDASVEPPVAEAPVEEKHDDNVGALVKAVEELLAAIKGNMGAGAETAPVATDGADCGTTNDDNTDSSEDQSQSMNNDSADEIVAQRLSICRIGDKLNMDGLEGKSIIEGKKAIISKVMPTMNLDGKDSAYIDVAYDMAVAEVTKRKDVDYQRQQMSNGEVRADGNQFSSSAEASRQRMIAREGKEGGNE